MSAPHTHYQREHGEITGRDHRVAADVVKEMPEGSFHEQTVFQAPEALPTAVPVGQASSPSLGTSVRLDLNALPDGEIRQAPDGWHAPPRMRGAERATADHIDLCCRAAAG